MRISKLIVLYMVLVFGNLSCGDDGDCQGACVCTGTECVCPSTGDCFIDCGGQCDLQCAGSGDCEFICGVDCLVSCTGSGACLISVDDGSTVSCPGSGGCDVDCDGDCVVECSGSGVCIVRCEPGLDCTINRCSGQVQSCANDIQVCNGSCPD